MCPLSTLVERVAEYRLMSKLARILTASWSRARARALAQVLGPGLVDMPCPRYGIPAGPAVGLRPRPNADTTLGLARPRRECQVYIQETEVFCFSSANGRKVKQSRHP